MAVAQSIPIDPRFLDPTWYTETFLSIPTKEQAVAPFIPNGVQRSYMKRATEEACYAGTNIRVLQRGLRDLVLKGRQHGFSTILLGAFLHDTMSNEGTNTVIIAHRKEAVAEMLNTIRIMYGSIPRDVPKPMIGRDNSGVIEFAGMNSKITVGVVGSGGVRSGTIHNLMCTEVAFWGRMEETMAAALEAVPMNGNIVAESTPNGVGGWYHTKVVESRGGNSSWRLFEYPWFLNRKYKIPSSEWPKYRNIKVNKAGTLEPYSPDEISLIMQYQLTPDQIAWRRWKIGESSARTFAQEYECDFIQSGRPVFLKDYVMIDPMTGMLRFKVPSKENDLSIIKNPVPGRQYLIGADVAEGLERGDYDAASVIDKITGQEVAKLRGHWPIDVYAEKLVDLLILYNGAVLVIERNNHGHACIQRVVQLLAAKGLLNRLYYSHDGRYGWPTNAITKSMLVSELDEALRKGYLCPMDANTIDELIAYEWKPNGTTGAPNGLHDDSVIGLGLANQGRKFVIVDDDEEDAIGVRSIG